MDRPGSKRLIGVALLASGAGMLLLAGLLLAALLPVAPDTRLVVGSALVVAGALDSVIGIRFLRVAD